MKFLLAILLACCAPLAHAQTIINIAQQTCNVALTACVLIGDGGQVITLNPQTVEMTVDGVPYTDAASATYAQTENTLYRRSYDVTLTFTPIAQLGAVLWFSRSGSGRGGWAWHQHWTFLTLTVY
jgi:hypothetical protein